MSKSDITIAVTGMNASENPGPGVSVIRALKHEKNFKGKIVGLTYDPLDPGVFMEKICDHAYLMPFPSEGKEVILERFMEIQFKTPIDVLIPTLDSELAPLISLEKELEDLGIKTFLPHKKGFDFRSKAKFNLLKSELDIQVPKGMAVSDPSALRSIQNNFSFPIMIKGQFYDAHIAWSPMEAEAYFNLLSSKWGLPVIVQEYIPGEEYDVVALGDGKGKVVGAVPMKKMQLTEKGKAWGGITIAHKGLTDFVNHVIKKLKWRGPCELEIMKSSENDEFYLLEINPRFPAWSYLAPGAGQNLQWATIMLALGEKVENFTSYEVGTLFLRNSIDHIYSLKDYQSMTTLGEIHRKQLSA